MHPLTTDLDKDEHIIGCDARVRQDSAGGRQPSVCPYRWPQLVDKSEIAGYAKGLNSDIWDSYPALAVAHSILGKKDFDLILLTECTFGGAPDHDVVDVQLPQHCQLKRLGYDVSDYFLTEDWRRQHCMEKELFESKERAAEVARELNETDEINDWYVYGIYLVLNGFGWALHHQPQRS